PPPEADACDVAVWPAVVVPVVDAFLPPPPPHAPATSASATTIPVIQRAMGPPSNIPPTGTLAHVISTQSTLQPSGVRTSTLSTRTLRVSGWGEARPWMRWESTVNVRASWWVSEATNGPLTTLAVATAWLLLSAFWKLE